MDPLIILNLIPIFITNQFKYIMGPELFMLHAIFKNKFSFPIAKLLHFVIKIIFVIKILLLHESVLNQLFLQRCTYTPRRRQVKFCAIIDHRAQILVTTQDVHYLRRRFLDEDVAWLVFVAYREVDKRPQVESNQRIGRIQELLFHDMPNGDGPVAVNGTMGAYGSFHEENGRHDRSLGHDTGFSGARSGL